MINIILLLIMTLFGAIGGYFFKRSSSYSIGLNVVFLMNLFIGGSLYLLGAILNVILLKNLPYTVVYPLTSITYIWTMIISKFFLKETISFKKVIGVFFIILGALIVAS